MHRLKLSLAGNVDPEMLPANICRGYLFNWINRRGMSVPTQSTR